MLTVGSLFSGIGGFDLGLERAGMRVIWQSEIDPYASAVLRKHWPDVPNLGDIREIRNPPVVDVLCGGFPCQDISTAGKGAGIDGERSGLWREYARIIGEIRPRFVFVENVAALLGRGLGRVLGDLAEIGYDAEWHCIPASAVGAPHRRDRLWIVAYANSEQPNGGLDTGAAERGEEASSSRAVVVGNASGSRACSRQANVADTDSERGRGGTTWGAYAANAWESSGCAQFGHWDAEPDVGRVANGVSNRAHRLRCLGNAIVPQIAEIIGRAIMRAAA